MLEKLRLLQPHFVVVGSGSWNDIDAIAGACGTNPLIIMRDMTENLIDLTPEQVMDNMAAVTARQFYKKRAFHLLNENYIGDVERSKSWELRAINIAQAPTVALNLSYGSDPDPRYKDVAEASEYIGPHLYDGWIEAENKWVDRIHTSRRYAANWLNDYRHKIIATEVGIESFPGTGQRRGWHDMGLSEGAVKDRLMANAMEWHADGLLGACWFTAGHTEQSWSEGYGLTELMARAWSRLPAPQQEDNVAITKQDLEAARIKIREEYLNVQRRHAAAKKNDSFTEMGAELESIFDLAGKGVNVTDTEFAELAKKL